MIILKAIRSRDVRGDGERNGEENMNNEQITNGNEETTIKK